MTEATSIATIFEDFAIDHTPDGWPAVKQMHLNAAAAELRRLQAAEDELLTALGACRDAMHTTVANVSEAIGHPLSVPAYVRESVSLLTAQRDELLEALKSVMGMMDDEIQTSSDAELAFGLSDPECPAHVKGELACVIACRAAIAKAEGGAA